MTSAKVSAHREELKRRLFPRDSESCLECSVGLVTGVNADLHEALISRKDMMGLPVPHKIELLCEFNCIVICSDCNRNSKLTRNKAWRYLCDLYGEWVMTEWFVYAQSFFVAPPPFPFK